ncbi:MAG TPA: hypothetical protein VFQ00_13820 [Terriglobales bacterium]|nr:hypothetical protein [Terriglobales bacterium]
MPPLLLTANPLTCSTFVSGPIDHTRDGIWAALEIPLNVTIATIASNSDRVALFIGFMERV